MLIEEQDRQKKTYKGKIKEQEPIRAITHLQESIDFLARTFDKLS